MDKMKKDVERWYLERFLSNKTLRLRIAGIVPLDPPDFKISRYIKKSWKEIGVELTRVMNPNLRQAESAQEKIVRLAFERFKTVMPDNLVVYVHFSNVPFSFTSSSLKDLSIVLCEFVKNVVLVNRGFNYNLETKDVLLNPVFESISIRNNDNYGLENWQPFGAFRVPYIEDSWFAEIIKKKEKKIDSYPYIFDENWLVLISNFGHQSSHFQFSNIKREFEKSAFDKIFIYKYREDEVMKLK